MVGWCHCSFVISSWKRKYFLQDFFFSPLTRTKTRTLEPTAKLVVLSQIPSCCHCCWKHFTCGYRPNIPMARVCVCVRIHSRECVSGRMCVCVPLEWKQFGPYVLFFIFQPMDQRPLYSLRHKRSVSTLKIQLST